VGDEDKSLAIVQATRRTAYGVHYFFGVVDKSLSAIAPVCYLLLQHVTAIVLRFCRLEVEGAWRDNR
jgi:hypothetical protein